MRTGELDATSREVVRRRFRADVSQERILVGPQIEDRHYQTARRLLYRYGPELGLRTLDSVQLSVALDLKRECLISVFLAADRRLCVAAEACGCPTVDPANPKIAF